jgi:DNA-binding transcriptional LysR family regulator
VPPISTLQRGLTFVNGAWGDDEPGGESFTLMPGANAALRTTHVDTNYAAALQGLGIAGLPSLVVEDALIEHALERAAGLAPVRPPDLGWHAQPQARAGAHARLPRVPGRGLRRRGPRPLAGRRGMRDDAAPSS